MASDKDTKKKPEPKGKSPTTKKGHPFLWGCFWGILCGIVVGWSVRPAWSYRVEELRKACGKGFLKVTDQSRDKIADLADDLARKLREGRH
jgi:hypothetical protein